jgi:membrane-bound ClpP family serine protease
MGAGLVLSFMPNIDQFNPSTEGWGDSLLDAFQRSLFALAMMAAGLLVAIAAAPRLAAMRRISVETAIDGTSEAPVTGVSLVGRRGVARTGLSPAGFITIDGAELSASSQHGEYVAPGATVEVVELRFGEAVVRPVESQS